MNKNKQILMSERRKFVTDVGQTPDQVTLKFYQPDGNEFQELLLNREEAKEVVQHLINYYKFCIIGAAII